MFFVEILEFNPYTNSTAVFCRVTCTGFWFTHVIRQSFYSLHGDGWLDVNGDWKKYKEMTAWLTANIKMNEWWLMEVINPQWKYSQPCQPWRTTMHCFTWRKKNAVFIKNHGTFWCSHDLMSFAELWDGSRFHFRSAAQIKNKNICVCSNVFWYTMQNIGNWC